ncbi:transcription repressor OFP17-like [Salvia divinorum]|uniref:Transcription repressor OFP17-like n=1 Tax=Salvia divinorum TaxID=28513 RepID=A0ABD1HQL6_SALDI
MKYLNLTSLIKRKLLKPCKKIVKFLVKLRPRKPLSIKSIRRRRRLSKMMTVFRPPPDEREMDRVTELTSFSDAAPHHRAPYPSPLTPAYIKMSAVAARVEEDDRVEEACRSFEKYLVEMIVDEGKASDLGDVEELLHCWKELRSPVFIDLVCRFYRELCTDLFSLQR